MTKIEDKAKLLYGTSIRFFNVSETRKRSVQDHNQLNGCIKVQVKKHERPQIWILGGFKKKDRLFVTHTGSLAKNEVVKKAVY
jgi:hypothetical protein